MDLTVAIAGVGVSVLLHCVLLMHSLRRELNSRCSGCRCSCPNGYISYLSPPASQENICFIILYQIVVLLEYSWKFYWKYVSRTSTQFPDGRMLLLASSGPYTSCCFVWENEMNGKQYDWSLYKMGHQLNLREADGQLEWCWQNGRCLVIKGRS